MLVNYLKGVFSSASRTNHLGLNKSLHPQVRAFFGRRIAEKSGSLADRLGERKFKKPDSGILEHDFEERADPTAKELDDKWMSLCHLNAQTLPENFMARIAKVFAKFPQEEVRKMGRTYMKLYSIIHATEKPMDISATKPFVNSNELLKGRESLIYLGKKYRHHEKPESETQAKEKKRKEKEKEEAMRKVQEGEVDPSDSAADPDYQTIVYDRHTALAYLQRKVPHTFGVASRILTELRYRLPDFKPQSFLDFGAGLGSGSYAFYDVYRNFQKIIAVEPSTPMRKLGKYLTQDLEQISWFDSLARLINVADHDGLFDIVYCGFVIEEAKTPEARMLIVETLWQKVRPGGLMILVEPGSPKGFRFVHDFREWVVQKSREEASIVAPCPHHHECPQARPAHIWCNFGQDIAKYPNRVFNKLPNQPTIDNEKFSFLVVKKGPILNNKEEAKTPAERSFFWPRLIRPTLKRGGHVILDTCNSAGAIERIVVAKSHKEDGAYKHAKKTEWGDLWCFGKRIPNRYRKESRIGERLW